MKSFRTKHFIYVTSIFIVCFVISFFMRSSAFADGDANTPAKPASSDCNMKANWETFCFEYSVSWKKYSYGSKGSDNKLIRNRTSDFLADALNYCHDKKGVNQVWYLAYDWINTDANGKFKSFNNDGQVTSKSYASVQVYQVEDWDWGSYPLFRNPLPSKYGADEVANNATVKKYWGQIPKKVRKNFTQSNWKYVTWFCWDDGWSETTGTFSADSTVTVPQQSNSNGMITTTEISKTSNVDSDINVNLTTYSDVFTVNFSHDLDFEAEDSFDDTNFKIPANYAVNGGSSKTTTDTPSAGTMYVSSDEDYDSVTIGGASQTLRLAVNEKRTICSTISYKSKKVKYTGSGTITPDGTVKHSSACATVTRVPKDIQPENFDTDSAVQVVPSGTGTADYDGITSTGDSGYWTNGKNKVGVAFSTDHDAVNVNFIHQIDYSSALHSWWFEYDDKGNKKTDANGNYVIGQDQATTNVGYWTYSIDKWGNVTTLNQATPASGTFTTACTGNPYYDSDNGVWRCPWNNGERSRSGAITVTGYGENSPLTVCQRITLSPSAFSIPLIGTYTWSGNTGYVPDDKWSRNSSQDLVGGGSTYSEACATVEKGPDPYGPGPSAIGDSSADIVYAGETTKVGWNAKADPTKTRRIFMRQANVYLLDSGTSLNETLLKGNLKGRSPTAADSMVYTNFSSNWNTHINYDSTRFDNGNNTGLTSYTEYITSPTISVPNYVGYKLCTNFGWGWQYYYGVIRDGEEWWGVQPFPSGMKNWYWTNYNSACRTIAKKPSTAVWNGGVFTQGGLTSSLSPRSDYNRLMEIKSGNSAEITAHNKTYYDSLRNYGTWAEDLVVAGKDAKDTASGDALAVGIKALGSNNDSISKETIANATNSSTKGNSGISFNTPFMTRLETYLKSHANTPLEYLPNYTARRDTRIFKVTGDLNITDNIEIGYSWSNIYEIPQNIIFVEGDVNISGNVTRIDAWIIATGTVKTCSDFVKNTTATATVSQNANTQCDKQLSINGPVIARNIELKRTAGAGGKYWGAKQEPAEVLNLTGLTYLWAYAQAGRYESSYTESYSRELPPRY